MFLHIMESNNGLQKILVVWLRLQPGNFFCVPALQHSGIRILLLFNNKTTLILQPVMNKRLGTVPSVRNPVLDTY